MGNQSTTSSTDLKKSTYPPVLAEGERKSNTGTKVNERADYQDHSGVVNKRVEHGGYNQNRRNTSQLYYEGARGGGANRGNRNFTPQHDDLPRYDKLDQRGDVKKVESKKVTLEKDSTREGEYEDDIGHKGPIQSNNPKTDSVRWDQTRRDRRPEFYDNNRDRDIQRDRDVQRDRDIKRDRENERSRDRVGERDSDKHFVSNSNSNNYRQSNKQDIAPRFATSPRLKKVEASTKGAVEGTTGSLKDSTEIVSVEAVKDVKDGTVISNSLGSDAKEMSRTVDGGQFPGDREQIGRGVGQRNRYGNQGRGKFIEGRDDGVPYRRGSVTKQYNDDTERDGITSSRQLHENRDESSSKAQVANKKPRRRNRRKSTRDSWNEDDNFHTSSKSTTSATASHNVDQVSTNTRLNDIQGSDEQSKSENIPVDSASNCSKEKEPVNEQRLDTSGPDGAIVSQQGGQGKSLSVSHRNKEGVQEPSRTSNVSRNVDARRQSGTNHRTDNKNISSSNTAGSGKNWSQNVNREEKSGGYEDQHQRSDTSRAESKFIEGSNKSNDQVVPRSEKQGKSGGNNNTTNHNSGRALAVVERGQTREQHAQSYPRNERRRYSSGNYSSDTASSRDVKFDRDTEREGPPTRVPGVPLRKDQDGCEDVRLPMKSEDQHRTPVRVNSALPRRGTEQETGGGKWEKRNPPNESKQGRNNGGERYYDNKGGQSPRDNGYFYIRDRQRYDSKSSQLSSKEAARVDRKECDKVDPAKTIPATENVGVV